MRSILSRLTPIASRTNPKACLSLESLGERVMPATGIFRSSLGIVTIEGTAGNDASQVSISGSNVSITLNSQTSTFALGKVKGLVFKGLNGDDAFTNNTNLISTAFGGNGNDVLTGGNATDLFFGGAGDDSLNGNSGNDTLNGELGDDRLFGGSGNDLQRGGSGSDDLQGGSGNDSLYGDDGDDRLNGDSGIDRISSGRGRDRTIRDSRDRSDDSEHIEGFQQVDGLAKVEGTISAIDGSNVTIRTRSGLDVQFAITASTVLEKNGVHVTLASFSVGDPAEAKFDALTRNAFKLESGEDGDDNGGGNQNGQSKIEGTITAVGSDRLSIRLQNGTVVTVLVNDTTKIERNDLHVPLSAFQVGDRGEARYDATSMIASKVEAVG